MEKETRLIPASACCTNYNVEYTFIQTLEEVGLIEVHRVQEQSFVPQNQLSALEQYTRLYNELGINTAGIEVITHLLQRMRTLQEELASLRQRLSLYEEAGYYDH
jgi:hypothetical protein